MKAKEREKQRQKKSQIIDQTGIQAKIVVGTKKAKQSIPLKWTNQTRKKCT